MRYIFACALKKKQKKDPPHISSAAFVSLRHTAPILAAAISVGCGCVTQNSGTDKRTGLGKSYMPYCPFSSFPQNCLQLCLPYKDNELHVI